MQLLIKLLHLNSNPNQSPIRQSIRKRQRDTWMPRFSHSFERHNLPELQQSKRRQLTQSQENDSDAHRENKPLNFVSNSTERSRSKFPYRFSIASSTIIPKNSQHLCLKSNKSKKAATINCGVQEGSQKRIFSRRKNFFVLKKQSKFKSTAKRVSLYENQMKKQAKSEILKLVGKSYKAKSQEIGQLSSQRGNSLL